MRIGIVGGGPAGLYFALLMKRQHPSSVIHVVEQNPAEATFGFGVVFSDRALGFLEEADAESYQDIERRLQTWDDQAIVHRDQEVRIDGLAFSGIGRLELLKILQAHCRRRGVELHFERRVTDPHTFSANYDIVVGADGVNSVVREAHQEHFEPSAQLLSNKYVWYGTEQRFDCLTLTFRENNGGAFVAHHYRYDDHRSTFIVECDAATWERAGFAGMTEVESRRYCERVFANDLGGHALLTNRSLWTNFRAITNRNWSYANVVLLGDALRTVHFSVGSGTRMALQDSIVLARAFGQSSDVEQAAREFERVRRPQVEDFLQRAADSFAWYERFRDKLTLDPLPLTYDYVMRSGRISHARLKQRSPRLAAAYEAYLGERQQPLPTA
jgi:anthraniloyl-CoA monooxygenase